MTDAIIHNYPTCPYVAKSCVHVRNQRSSGRARITLRVPLRDEEAARAWLARAYPSAPIRVINHTI
jgi:hypothetical protein